MTNQSKEFRSNVLSRNPKYLYLPEKDRYLFKLDQPLFKFNVIGVGMMGQEHIMITLMEGRASIHGIFDPNPRSIGVTQKGLQTQFPGLDLVVYTSLEDACNDPAVDGLIISTPNFTHLEILKTAIKSGKHIFLEKPMATTIPDAYEIMKIANEYTAVLQIGLQYRYKAMYNEAIHEVFSRKSLGNIKMIQIQEHRIPFLDKVNQWNKFSKFSGGTLVEKCCHYFDLMNLFAQAKPIKVFASGSMAVNFREFEYNNEKSDILDNAFVIVDYENGVRAAFTLCMFAPQFYEEIVICGDEGRLRAQENEDFLSVPRSKTQLEIYRGEIEPSRLISPAYPSYLEGAGHNGATFFEHRYFIDNILGKETSVAAAEDGFWSVVVGAAAEESVKTGKPVFVEELLHRLNITL